jgi:4-alpha-glucanotransferase
MTLPRSAGVLLHVTSLPSGHGIGDFGPAADAWVDLLGRNRIRWWQVLPLVPAGPGDSPYTSDSCFAGDLRLVSLERMAEEGWLTAGEIAGDPGWDGARAFKAARLATAMGRFRERDELAAFEKAEGAWLEDHALFVALKGKFGGKEWREWPSEIRRREAGAVAAARKELTEAIAREKFGQFVWFRQWARLRARAHAAGTGIVGDMPIFVADDSSDVWAHPEGFLFDRELRPKAVAGVPPDYFAEDGQLWGNPLYDWEAMARDGYGWWTRRAKHAARLFDLTRIDHFRGFSAAWHVSPGAKTAKNGTWVPGPGVDFFDHLRREMGGLPMIAEDLGTIDDAARALRRATGLPGMAVLQFAFHSGPENAFLPANLQPETVIYTGTHDNDTTAGWYASLTEEEKHPVRVALATDGTNISWTLMNTALASVAKVAIVPLQDVLQLGSESRMNTPGVAKGNWRWRVGKEIDVAGGVEMFGRQAAKFGR